MRYSPWRQPQAGIGCITAHTDFIEDTTGETVLPMMTTVSLLISRLLKKPASRRRDGPVSPLCSRNASVEDSSRPS